ncbi:MAG: hypothetical protein M3261_01370 [Thermoproteota archaeon]|nr:hypothetical protein [Thermoproteota archaeon]
MTIIKLDLLKRINHPISDEIENILDVPRAEIIILQKQFTNAHNSQSHWIATGADLSRSKNTPLKKGVVDEAVTTRAHRETDCAGISRQYNHFRSFS